MATSPALITPEPAAPEEPASYRRLFAIRGMVPLVGSSLLSRTALMMSSVAFALLGLQRFHSASIAGLSIFLLIFPGLVVSPINGALLDRFGRRRLMVLDLAVAASGLLLLALLTETNRLGIGVLLLVVSLVSLTSTLSAGGSRSLFPLLVPNSMWERANATDAICYGLAAVAGPGLAGAVTGWLGNAAALVVIAIGYVLAAVAMLRVPEPAVARTPSRGILRDAWQGLRLVLSNRTLRWCAVAMSLLNMSVGLIAVALPVIVLALHGSAASVGGLFALQGLAGVPAALMAGRMRSLGRERGVMAMCFVATGAAVLLLLLPSVAWLAVAMACVGLLDGPVNVALFSLRQRRTSREWFGRAFAISIGLNYAGTPIGAAAAGPLVSHSVSTAVVIAAALPLVAAFAVMRIPRE
ncbi:MAG: MFS transporter [Candidatus Dormibacteraeota bacterium]|nr:MFS transporter [Candidatus Dormibacteraeota bacterium]MBV9525583.1 MFS transporter [Candidatus Dormibacteraeota bacterium]